MTNQTRVHAGVPTGGQFASHDRADADATLPAPFDPENPNPVIWKGENIALEFTYIGEGYNGDYDSEDPHDIPMFRLDTYVRHGAFEDIDLDGPDNDEWDVPSGGSYCTGLPTDTSPERLERYLRRIGTRMERLIALPHTDAGEVIRSFADRTAEVSDNSLDQLAYSSTLMRLDRAISDESLAAELPDGTFQLDRKVRLAPQYDTGELTIAVTVKVKDDQATVELSAIDAKRSDAPRTVTYTEAVDAVHEGPAQAALVAAVAAIDDYLSFTA